MTIYSPFYDSNSKNYTNKLVLIANAAYQLFLEYTYDDISIQEITDHAGVAKGTFYLYFHDKAELKRLLIAMKARELFRLALEALRATEIYDLEEQIIFVVNYVINLLIQNPTALHLISRDLAPGLFSPEFRDYFGDEADLDLTQVFLTSAANNNIQLRAPQVLFFMIVELTGSTCYSCILESCPLSIQDYKPFLFETIRNMVRSAIIR